MFIIIPVLLVAIALIGPRRLFWAVGAWAFKHPEAHEPSDMADVVGRVVAAVGAAAVVVLTIAYVDDGNDRRDVAAEQQASQAEFESEFWAGRASCWEIEDELSAVVDSAPTAEVLRARAQEVLDEHEGTVLDVTFNAPGDAQLRYRLGESLPSTISGHRYEGLGLDICS